MNILKRYKVVLLLLPVVVLLAYLAYTKVVHLTTENPTQYSLAADTIRLKNLAEKARYYISKPESLPADMDSALVIATQILLRSQEQHFERGIGTGYLIQSEVYRESGDAEKGKIASRKALTLLSKWGTPEEKAKALIEVGGTYSNSKSQLPQKIAYYRQGMALFHQMGKYQNEAGLREFIGDLYFIDEDYTAAIGELNQAISLYQQTGYTRLHGVYNLIGSVHKRTGNFVEALKYNLMAAKTGEQVKDSGSLMITIYNWLAMNYLEISNYENAYQYFDKGLSIAYRLKDTLAIQTLETNKSDALRIAGRPADALALLQKAEGMDPFTDPTDKLYVATLYLKIYTALQDVENADLYYRKVIAFFNAPDVVTSAKQNARLAAATFLQHQKQFAPTYAILYAFAQEKDKTPTPLIRLANYESLYYTADSARGNILSALQHYQLFKTYSDSLFNINKTRQFGQLQLQYETEKKDENIHLLTQKNELQNAVIHKEQFTRNITISAVVLLLLLLALSYNRYRLKQHSNARLQQQQEEINRQNELLKKVLNEKEWLLKEIHHRVKNNLQIIISLLNTQSAYLDNEEAVAAIQNSQHRMHAMSLIHQKLYQSDNMASINMNWYIRELVEYIKDCFGQNKRLAIHTDIDPITLDLVQAVPLSLVLNESVTNAIKYAFPNGRPGTIYITMKWIAQETCRLTIADDGIGLPPGFDGQQAGSLGMSLMYGLSEQAGGTLHLVSNGEGTQLSITFPVIKQLAEGESPVPGENFENRHKV